MDGHFFTGCKLPEEKRAEYAALLQNTGLRDEKDCDYFVLVSDSEDRLIACGSLRHNVLKQIAVSESAEGSGYCAYVVSELISEAVRRGESHLFIYTKPANKAMFASLGFYPIVQTVDMLMMENRKDGLSKFLAGLPHFDGDVGAVVCNCNPFTNGHRHLIEYACKHCEELIVFVVSENASMFSSSERFEMVTAGIKDIPNAHVVQSGDYIISRATFPDYFLKESSAVSAKCDLDIALFAARIAPELGIIRRFVGEELNDPITGEYNAMLRRTLPQYGIELVEIPRLDNISASWVRRAIIKGMVGEIRSLVPETTYEYILSHTR